MVSLLHNSVPLRNCTHRTSTTDPETQPDVLDSQQEQEKAERGAKTAENVRYGQTISEGGMGGMTTEAAGSANQGQFAGMGTLNGCWEVLMPINLGSSYGATTSEDKSESAAESRQEQQYGPGSGVGA